MLYVFSLLRILASSLVRFSGVLAEPNSRCRMVGANPTSGDEVFATSRTKKDYGGWLQSLRGVACAGDWKTN